MLIYYYPTFILLDNNIKNQKLAQLYACGSTGTGALLALPV